MSCGVTVRDVQERWCFGLPLTKEDGSKMSGTDIQAFIDGAVATVERKLGIYITPRKIRCNAEYLEIPEDEYDVSEPPYDYRIDEYRHWGFIQLRQKPVISVERVQLRLPNDLQVVDFDKKWIKLYPKVGQINIVPYAGSPMVMSIAGATASSLPLLTGQFGRNLPQCIWIDYTAGLKEMPMDIQAIVGKMASIDILGIAGDAILAGVASLSTSIDGLSESFSTTASATNATYGAHILQYQKEIDAFFDPKDGGARQFYKGMTMRIL